MKCFGFDGTMGGRVSWQMMMAACSAFVDTCLSFIFILFDCVWTMSVLLGCHSFWPSRVGCTWSIILCLLLVVAVLWADFVQIRVTVWRCSWSYFEFMRLMNIFWGGYNFLMF